jgi:hypothetical protein
MPKSKIIQKAIISGIITLILMSGCLDDNIPKDIVIKDIVIKPNGVDRGVWSNLRGDALDMANTVSPILNELCWIECGGETMQEGGYIPYNKNQSI